MEIKEQLIIQLNTEESLNRDNLVRSSNNNNFNKNYSDCKKPSSKKNFFKNLFDKENFDHGKDNNFCKKPNKNSSVKNTFFVKKLNFFENEVS